MSSLNSFRAKAGSSADTDVVVYTVPAGKQFANVALNLLNYGNEAAKVRVGITINASMTPVDAIEFETELAANGGQLRRTSLYLSAGEKLIVRSNKSTVAIRAVGLEQNGVASSGKGKLGAAMSVANSHVTPYVCPATGVQFATVFILATNTGNTTSTIRVAITDSPTPGNNDYINIEVPLDANGGTYEYPCQIMHPGEKVMVLADSSSVAVRVHGLEEA